MENKYITAIENAKIKLSQIKELEREVSKIKFSISEIKNAIDIEIKEAKLSGDMYHSYKHYLEFNDSVPTLYADINGAYCPIVTHILNEDEAAKVRQQYPDLIKIKVYREHISKYLTFRPSSGDHFPATSYKSSNENEGWLSNRF